jgi:hypothetical protein
MIKMVSKEDATKLRRERVQNTFQLDAATTITLRGKVYTLELTNYAVKGIYKDTGHNLMALGFSVQQMTDPEMMGSLLFWALQQNHPELTQDEVDKLFTYRHYGYILDRLKDALDLFLPDMSDVQVEEARKQPEEGEDPS